MRAHPRRRTGSRVLPLLGAIPLGVRRNNDVIQPLLTESGCRRRQQRLQLEIQEAGWDCFLTGSPRTIYSLTGALIPLEQPCLFLLKADGGSALISGYSGAACAEQVIPVELYSPAKPIESPALDAARALAPLIPGGRQRIGIDAACTPITVWLEGQAGWMLHDADAVVLRLRRQKDEDEIEEIRRSLALNAIAYDAARRLIRAGLTELELHSAMSMAVARELGTAIPIAGDFACGLRSVREGGAPTARVIEPGELCVLDLFIAPAYYFGDTCRTFCAGKPNSLQRAAWGLVLETLRDAESMLWPGVRASELYHSVRRKLDSDPISQRSFWHHAGHGIGYWGHEAPRLIPESEDTIQEGDLVAVEPGIYVESLGGGLRLENTYRAGSDTVLNLFDYPIGLELL